MTTLSPEIVGSDAVRSVSVAGDKLTLLPDSDAILLLARLGCLSSLLNSPQQFSNEYSNAVREELMFRLSKPEWRSKLQPWLSYRWFERAVCADIDDFSRDVLSSRVVLGRINLDQLFAPHASWSDLVAISRRDVQNAVENFNRENDLADVLKSAYQSQRQLLLRELAVKFLPTIVLMASAAVALVMAFFVWRSLGTGG